MKSRPPQVDLWRKSDGSPIEQGYHQHRNTVTVTGTATGHAIADLLKADR